MRASFFTLIAVTEDNDRWGERIHVYAMKWLGPIHVTSRVIKFWSGKMLTCVHWGATKVHHHSRRGHCRSPRIQHARTKSHNPAHIGV